MMKPIWQSNPEELYSLLETDPKKGLRIDIAKQRQEKGFNELPEAELISPWRLFLNQFKSSIIWILIGAALIAGLLQEWIDATAIGLIIVLNAIFGFIQEYQAERSLAALKKMTRFTSKVIRDDQLQTIPSREIVPGDLILLEAGDRVPADGRIIESMQLTTQEAALTGETTSISKINDSIQEERLPIGDRKNMAFMGTNVVHGKGYMIVTETGLNTEMGKIAALLQASKEEPTPLQERLEKFGRLLVGLSLGIIICVFTLGLIRGYSILEMVLTSLSLAVAAIPEGLPAVVTITLAVGVRKMAKRHALIRRLPSVETLGCTTVICTDKTGTLTENEMVVRAIWLDNTVIEVSGNGYDPEGELKQDGKIIDPKDYPDLILLLKAASLCNNASLYQENGQWVISGDPTEGALLVAAEKVKLNKKELEAEYPFIDELPFDSERKRMSVLLQTEQGNRLFVKGAPGAILRSSDKIIQNQKILPFTAEKKEEVTQVNHQLASQGLRVLAFAYRNLSEDHVKPEFENELIFIGLMAMQDPPRREVKKAIEDCRTAGVKTVMITGDNKDTALAIAKELQIFNEHSLALEGKELDQISESQFEEEVKDVAVYARVSAEHKLKIVRALKNQNEIVAMTGDGVNDAPAIKEADIGIAMGLTGTDVTKEAADMVITDDNFASIVSAIEEGRGIYDNIVKFVSYLLSSNIAEILVIFLGMLLNFKDLNGQPFTILLPVQLLWMNLITDGFPAIAIGLDPIAPETMKKPPRHPNGPLITWPLALQLISISVLVATGTLIACYFGLPEGKAKAQTIAFTTLVVLELVRAQMVRAPYKLGLLSNSWLLIALITSLLLQLAVIYIPLLQIIFGTVSLNQMDWLMIATITGFIWLIGTGLTKLFWNRMHPKA